MAVWDGVIAPNSNTDFLASALDFFPTFSSLAGVSLPSDRVYDGVDLTSVFAPPAGGQPTTDRVLFHPNSGCEGVIGEVDTVRFGRFKAKYLTGGTGCTDCQGHTGHVTQHDPPLLFDLWLDPEESRPLVNASLAEKMTSLRDQLAASIRSDNVSVSDYANDPHLRPCCNESHAFCMCQP